MAAGRMHGGGRRRRRGVAAMALVLCLAGCGSDGAGEASPGPTTAASPSRAAASPDAPTLAPGLAAVAGQARAGLEGEVLQFRRDVAARRLQIRLTAANAGLVVEGVTVRAPRLSVQRDRPVDAQLRGGTGLDLPVVMGAPDCTGAAGPAVAVVRLRDATGARRTVEVPLDDDGLLARLHAADCADRALRAQADIRVVGATPVRSADGPALRIDIRLTRLSGHDPVRITGTGSNTVYTITPVGALPTLHDDGPALLVVDLVPSRCDAHALGESYRTALIDLVVTLGDADPQPFVLTPGGEVRRRLEAFAVETCRGTAD